MSPDVQNEIAPIASTRRGWMWKWIVACLVTATPVAGLWGWRQYRLSLIPNVGDPFDVAAFLESSRAIDDQNAFHDYREAVKFFREPNWQQIKGFEHPDLMRFADYPQEFRDHVEANGTAMNLWLKGTACLSARQFPPSLLNFSPPAGITSQLRGLIRTVVWKSAQLQDRGELQESIKLLHAGLRSAVHLWQSGTFYEELSGAVFHAHVSLFIVRWGEDPRVSAGELRDALHEIQEIYRRFPPVSSIIKSEYMIYRDYGQIVSQMMPSQGFLMMNHLTGDADFHNRLERVKFRNWLASCDLPRRERDADPGTGLTRRGDLGAGVLAADEIEKLKGKSLMPNFIESNCGQMIWTSDRDQFRRTALQIFLALQIYYREHQKFPEELSALVPEILSELPDNPYSKKREPPLYRVEAERVLMWSHGDFYSVPAEEGSQYSRPGADGPLFWTIYAPGMRAPLYRGSGGASDGGHGEGK